MCVFYVETEVADQRTLPRKQPADGPEEDPTVDNIKEFDPAAAIAPATLAPAAAAAAAALPAPEPAAALAPTPAATAEASKSA
jgi:hypothetical protein